MGNPCLLQELPNIASLLSQCGGDGEQSAAADGALAGLDTMANLALNHRLAQGTFCGVIGGLDSTDLQKGPKGIGHLEDLPAGADRFGPRRSLAAWMAQLHHPLQRGLKGLADRPAGLLQVGPIDGSFLVAVPLVKQLLLPLQQLRSVFGTGARAFGDGGEIADQMGPADLASLQGKVVVGREAIAHHNPAKAIPEQLHGGGCGATQALDEHRHHGRHHDPLPAPPSRGIAAIRVACGGAGFIHVSHRLRAGSLKRLCHRLLQGCAQSLADCCDRSAADLHSQKLIEQRPGLAETQRKGRAQQAHQRTEPGPVGAGLHIRRQRGAGAGGTTGAHQPVLDHQRSDRRNLNHLMTQGLWILSIQQGAATAARLGVVVHHLIHPLDRQRLRPGSRVAWLAATLAATALAPLQRLETRPIAGGRFGGVARAATDPLPQAGQLGRQGGEFAAEFRRSPASEPESPFAQPESAVAHPPAKTTNPLLESRPEGCPSQKVST